LIQNLKKAISNLSSTEKDKLIFRLLKHDLTLANQLVFELLDVENVEQKRAKMEKRVAAEVERM
jgi:DNA-directed RNA polymerase subunit L